MTHIPVLESEAIELLNPQKGETVIDVTLGLGGHASAFLSYIGKKGLLVGIDADKKNLEEAKKVLSGKNVKLIHGNFRDVICTPGTGVPQADILFADLGLSSPHIDDPERGFTFREDSPLDLRFDQTQGQSASDLLMSLSLEELAEIFQQYGELERAYPFAQAVCTARDSHTLERTSDLTQIAEEAYQWKAKKKLPQIFQALRIAVNDEVSALENLLDHGPTLLKPGGRMGVISYHSLEDRLVKQRFRALTAGGSASYELLTKKAIQPTLEEVEQNPRARSARFRCIQKLS